VSSGAERGLLKFRKIRFFW